MALTAMALFVTLASSSTAGTEGIAVARSPVRVHAGTAQLFLTCHEAPCTGVAKFVAQLGSGGADEPKRRIVIARTSFSIPAETRVELRIALNREGRVLMRGAKPSGRYVLLEGQGLRNRTLILKRVRSFPPL